MKKTTQNACEIQNMQLSSEDLTVKHSNVQTHTLFPMLLCNTMLVHWL